MARGAIYVYLSLLFLGFTSCSKKLISITSFPDSAEEVHTVVNHSYRSLPQDYAPANSRKVLRMFFHFFNNQDSTINFNPGEGCAIAERLLKAANHRLEKNDKMHLPEGNNTPRYDTRIRYELSDYKGKEGIFYHYLNEPEYFIKKGTKANRYDRKIIREYAIEEERTINVFVLPFDPGQLKSGEQQREMTAIALGHTIKLPGLYQSDRALEDYAGMFNHEVGHILGLRHTWDRDDGCPDTPLNDNCWNTGMASPCDGLTSNNLMDYNAHQSAITPCQIALMHSALAHPERSAGKLVAKRSIEKDVEDVIIRDSVRWSLPKEVTGNMIIESGATVYCTSLILMPVGSHINIKKGGTLIVEGATLKVFGTGVWEGIMRHPKGQLITIGPNNLLLNIQSPDLKVP